MIYIKLILLLIAVLVRIANAASISMQKRDANTEAAPASKAQPTTTTYKVMMINFDPVFDLDGKQVKMHKLMKSWNDPYKLADKFANAMSEVSYGNVNYAIAEKIELNEFPKNKKGAVYNTDTYYKTLMEACDATDGCSYWTFDGWEKTGFTFDYESYFEKYNVYEKVNSGEIDEVWFFGGPMVGVDLYESMMTGKDAFFVNGRPIIKKNCRNFISYGFNYERGLGEMLENAGHRTEHILTNVFGVTNYKKDYSQYNDYEKFSAYDLVSKGNAGVGSIHFAPNSVEDYDWGNRNDVMSYCDNWLNYPDLSGDARVVNCSDWGNGDITAHHKWWFKHLPHADGINEETGKYNNWWKYFSLDYINKPTTTDKRCGKGIGHCKIGECCSKYGWCGKSDEHCYVENGCQSEFGECKNHEGRCGKGIGHCNIGECCSKYGWCGKTNEHCNVENGCQSEFGECKKIHEEGRCGKGIGQCKPGECCSKYGWCGKTDEYCNVEKGCQSEFGECKIPEGRCGKGIGQCKSGECCSKHGWCGKSDKHCNVENGCQSEFGECKNLEIQESSEDLNNVSPDGRCGKGIGHCKSGECCSKYGWCGQSDKHCNVENGCQSEFGKCW